MTEGNKDDEAHESKVPLTLQEGLLLAALEILSRHLFRPWELATISILSYITHTSSHCMIK
jgi:hypothetical protein